MPYERDPKKPKAIAVVAVVAVTTAAAPPPGPPTPPRDPAVLASLAEALDSAMFPSPWYGRGVDVTADAALIATVRVVDDEATALERDLVRDVAEAARIAQARNLLPELAHALRALSGQGR